MAGSYPDVPGKRFRYEEDGTIWFGYDPALVHFDPQVATNKQLNDESVIGGDFYVSSPWIDPSNRHNISKFGLLFPEKRDLMGVFAGFIDAGTGHTLRIQNFAVSHDTTNGLDGTWTTVLA